MSRTLTATLVIRNIAVTLASLTITVYFGWSILAGLHIL